MRDKCLLYMAPLNRHLMARMRRLFSVLVLSLCLKVALAQAQNLPKIQLQPVPAQTPAGEIYALMQDGKIFKIVAQ